VKNLWRAWRFFRPDILTISLVLVLLLLSIGANLLKPWPLALMVDGILGHKPWPAWLGTWTSQASQPVLLGLLVASMVAVHWGQALLSAAQTYLLIQVGLRGLARVRKALFHWLQRLSWRFHQGARQGDVIYRASWDTYAFQNLFQHGLFTFLGATLSLACMVAVMWRMNRPLTWIALGTIPLLVPAIQLFGRQMRARSLEAQQADSQVTSLVQQGIAALPLTQSFVREAEEENRFNIQVDVALRRRLAQHGCEVLYLAVISAIFGLGLAAIVWAGAGLVGQGRLTVGELLVFLAYLTQFYEPLNQLSHVGATVSSAGAGTQRVFEILDTPEEVRESPEARRVVRPGPVHESPKPNSIPESPSRKGRLYGACVGSLAPVPEVATSNALVAQGAIEFEDVHFSYDQRQPVLRGVSFRLAAGETAALVGPSGVGKTTLLHLLVRFFDPTRGAVRLDGVDLRWLRLGDLRSQVGLVMQEPILLPATVAENIGYGRAGATRDEIEAAARAAHAEEFIRRMPRQYDTVIGEGAARLSTGEKQRLNLARAFLKNAPILVLDEPTSALDAESEAFVVASLGELMRGRTVLMVAHRFTTIRGVNQILVLEGGRLTESGSPDVLRQGQGYFARVSAP
jgi:ATP-binding cassette, subfamily B, bacterial